MKTFTGKTLCCLVLGLAVIAFTQAPTLNAKQYVERPFRISGQISFLPFSDEGVATHFGTSASFTDDPDFAAGWYETANSDLVYWEVVSFDPDTLDIVIGFTGGTGRFEDATGEFTATMIPVDWNTLTFDYEGEGTIRY
jgi:hypothetical protein